MEGSLTTFDGMTPDARLHSCLGCGAQLRTLLRQNTAYAKRVRSRPEAPPVVNSGIRRGSPGGRAGCLPSAGWLQNHMRTSNAQRNLCRAH